MAHRLVGVVGNVLAEDWSRDSEGDARFCVAFDLGKDLVTLLIVPGVTGGK
jgi:hypothetical protein